MKLPPPFSKNKKYINAVIETPKGSAAKYNWDEQTQSFKLKKILPAGQVFPYHFGFIPFTKGEDGDPLDILVLLDEASWPGCIIECTLIGVMEATETKKNKTVRNDRLIATANASEKYSSMKDISSGDHYLVNQIENFFNSYNNLENKDFKVISIKGAQDAIDLVTKQLTDADTL